MIANFDLRRAFTGVLTVPSVTGITATGNSSSIDTLPANGPFTFDISIGAVTGTTPTLAIQVQDSPDNVTFTNVTGPNAGAPTSLSNITATGRFFIFVAVSVQRFIRLAYTVTGTTPVYPLSAVVWADARISGTGGGFSISPQV